MNGPQDVNGRIVVGVDGSPLSKAALRWALGQAKLTGATVDAVLGWEYPAFYGWTLPVSEFDFEANAGQILGEAVEEVLGADSSVTVHSRIVPGNPGTVLVQAADGAQLLVVGSQGHGGISSALLGSVSQYCAHHSPCPVVIVRDES